MIISKNHLKWVDHGQHPCISEITSPNKRQVYPKMEVNFQREGSSGVLGLALTD